MLFCYGINVNKLSQSSAVKSKNNMLFFILNEFYFMKK